MSLVGFKAQNHQQQVLVHGPRSHVDDRATTPEDFAPWHERFAFTIDVAAAAHNAKLPRYYTIDDDGLEQDWSGERVYCNPPYSSIEPWVEKAWREWCSSEPPELIVMLLPANRCEQAFWQRWIEPFRDGRGTRPGETYIRLTNSSQRVLIDDADVPAVCAYRWRLDSNGYATTSLPRVNGKNRNMRLHRFLAGLEHGDALQCDHINRDRLDNRRTNLRVVSAAENGRNREVYSNNTSGFKGVSFDKRAGRWEASIKLDYHKRFIGYFDTPEEAAAAYDVLAERLHGQFASPNAADEHRGFLNVEFLPGRLRFLKPGQKRIAPNERPPFGCCLVIWGSECA